MKDKKKKHDHDQEWLRKYLSFSELIAKRPTSEEEKVLLEKIKRDNDSAAHVRIIEGHLYLVLIIARMYKSNALTLGDLINEGVQGLEKALKNFGLEFENRFATYAKYYVKGEISKAVRREQRDLDSNARSLNEPMVPEEDEELGEIVGDVRNVPADIQMIMEEVRTKMGLELETYFDFIDGIIIDPFQRRNIIRHILQAKRSTGLGGAVDKIDWSLFSGSNPYERRTLFKIINGF